jgi:hypothetical protein
MTFGYYTNMAETRQQLKAANHPFGMRVVVRQSAPVSVCCSISTTRLPPRLQLARCHLVACSGATSS